MYVWISNRENQLIYFNIKTILIFIIVDHQMKNKNN
jgi:hypothetical protein